MFLFDWKKCCKLYDIAQKKCDKLYVIGKKIVTKQEQNRSREFMFSAIAPAILSITILILIYHKYHHTTIHIH